MHELLSKLLKIMHFRPLIFLSANNRLRLEFDAQPERFVRGQYESQVIHEAVWIIPPKWAVITH